MGSIQSISSSGAAQEALTDTQGCHPSLWSLPPLFDRVQTSWDLKRWEGGRDENMVGVRHLLHTQCSCLVFTMNLWHRVTSLLLISGSRWLTMKGHGVKLNQGLSPFILAASLSLAAHPFFKVPERPVITPSEWGLAATPVHLQCLMTQPTCCSQGSCQSSATCSCTLDCAVCLTETL